jgi:hypothetical protein
MIQLMMPIWMPSFCFAPTFSRAQIRGADRQAAKRELGLQDIDDWLPAVGLLRQSGEKPVW